MSTMQAILSAARSGMTVSQTQAALVSRNISNAQTPGYAFEVLPINAALGGLGAIAGTPVAMRQTLLERALSTANGRVGYHDAQIRHLGIAEQAVNDLDGSGLGPAIEGFRAALAPLAANPAGGNERSAFLAAARSLGSTFSITRTQMDESGLGLREEAKAVAAQVNSIASEVAAIDSRISSARPGEEANTLVARRSSLIQSLSSLVSVDVIPRPDGTVHISAGGRALVEGGQAAQLLVSIDGPPARNIGINFQKADGMVVPAMDSLGGQLGGVIESHDKVVVPALDQLDQLAYDFMNEFNTLHQAGYGLDGQTGRPFFEVPTDPVGAAGQVKLASGMTTSQIAAAADPAGVPGDNSNLLQLGHLLGGGGAVPIEQSLLREWQMLGGTISQSLAEAQSGLRLEADSRDQLDNLLASQTGVSIEEEMIRMTQAQTALEAASSVIREAQKMNDTVLALVG